MVNQTEPLGALACGKQLWSLGILECGLSSAWASARWGCWMRGAAALCSRFRTKPCHLLMW